MNLFRRGRVDSARQLNYPLETPSRLAVIEIDALLPDSARQFQRSGLAELRRFAPQAIACSFPFLRKIAHPRIESLDYPLLVVCHSASDLLTREQRDWVWHTFGLPLFEQLRDSKGRLLAEECDAHAGLHVVTPARLGLSLLDEPCACGTATARIHLPATSKAPAAHRVATA